MFFTPPLCIFNNFTTMRMFSRFLFAFLATFMFVAAPAFAQVAEPVPLLVSVTADTSFTRSYTWSIVKVVTPTALTLSVGET